jgi:hypothetical protein
MPMAEEIMRMTDRRSLAPQPAEVHEKPRRSQLCSAFTQSVFMGSTLVRCGWDAAIGFSVTLVAAKRFGLLRCPAAFEPAATKVLQESSKNESDAIASSGSQRAGQDSVRTATDRLHPSVKVPSHHPRTTPRKPLISTNFI